MFQYIGILGFLIFSETIVSQNITRQLDVTTGTGVEFFFQYFNDFQFGKEKLNHTKLTVYYTDSTNAGDPSPLPEGWSLKVKADIAFLSSFFGTSTLPLNTISIETTDAYANTTQVFLSDAYQEIASWKPTEMDTINSYESLNLSYTCGQNTSVADSIDGEYRVLLMFLLE